MLPSDDLEADLRQALAAIAQQPLAEFLLQKGILRSLSSDLLRQRLCESVVFSSEELPLVISRLFQGIAIDPPTALGPGWLEALPPMLQGPLRERWDQIRLQKWMEVAYRERVEPYFLERRRDLEQVVYGMIRLRHQGVAEELYLRLLDDQADFGELAKQYSLGEERFTRGLVGPIQISQPHPTIRAVLQQLAVGDLHPPFSVENWVLLVRMEHRQPAQLTDSLMLQLCQELLQQDLDACLDEQLQALYPALVETYPPLLVLATAVPAASQPLSTAVVTEPAAAAEVVLDLPPASPLSPPAVPESPAARPGPPAAEPMPAGSCEPVQPYVAAEQTAAPEDQPPRAPAAPPPPPLPQVSRPSGAASAAAPAAALPAGFPEQVPPPAEPELSEPVAVAMSGPASASAAAVAVDPGQQVAAEPEPAEPARSDAAAAEPAAAPEGPLAASSELAPPPVDFVLPPVSGAEPAVAGSMPAGAPDLVSAPAELEPPERFLAAPAAPADVAAHPVARGEQGVAAPDPLAAASPEPVEAEQKLAGTAELVPPLAEPERPDSQQTQGLAVAAQPEVAPDASLEVASPPLEVASTPLPDVPLTPVASPEPVAAESMHASTPGLAPPHATPERPDAQPAQSLGAPAVPEVPLAMPAGSSGPAAATLLPLAGSPEHPAALPPMPASAAARPSSPQPVVPAPSVPAPVATPAAEAPSAPQVGSGVDPITGLSIAAASDEPVVVAFPLSASPLPPPAPSVPASPQSPSRGSRPVSGAAAPAPMTIRDIPLPLLSEVIPSLDASGAAISPGPVLSRSGLTRPLPSDWRAISRRLPRAVPTEAGIISPILSERPPAEPGAAAGSRDEGTP